MVIHRRTSTGQFELYEQSNLWAMGKLEWDLEGWLAENRQLLFPNDDVFIFGRQSHLGPAGISDLLGFDEMGNLFVIELKRGTHGRQCIVQALDYVSELADREYSDFQKLWRDYQEKLGRRASDLRKAHQKFHKLVAPIEESDFNRTQYIVIVSGGPDGKAERISGWLKSADVPIYYSTFSIYQGARRARDFLIDVSPVEVAPGPKPFNNDFWLNSDEKHVPGSFPKMIKHGLACTYGPIEYGQKLQPFEQGSRIFLYVSKMGVAAEGIVKESWSGKESDKPLTLPKGGRKCPEYCVPVEWTRVAKSPEQAVTASEIRAMGHKLFIPTSFRISAQLAEKLSERLKQKCGK